MNERINIRSYFHLCLTVTQSYIHTYIYTYVRMYLCMYVCLSYSEAQMEVSRANLLMVKFSVSVV